MKNMYLTIGIILLLVSLYAFLRDSLIIGVVVVLVAVFFIYPDARAMVAGKSISTLTYNSIIEQGVRKIDGGSTIIKKENFLESMEKIRDLLSEQQFVPIVGYDSVYLQYNNEAMAANALKQVLEKGLKGDLIQDKSTWSVRILL
jgi:hypothetical protein